MKKKLLASFLAFCMILSLIPSTAFAAGSNLPFTDVDTTDWFYDAVQYAYEKGMMSGTSTTAFSPGGTTSRGMIVTVLHRMEGTPAASGAVFTDVPDGQWYTNAVAWASANNIVGGYGNGLFGPDDVINREQMASILYRYSQYKNYTVDASGSIARFADAAKTSSYAVDAMNWAVGSGLISGVNGNLEPNGGATRAQVATILKRYCENVVPARTSAPETSVPDITPTQNTVDTTYTVTFDLNYGSDTQYDRKTVKEGETVSKPSNPSRSGYSFSGWYTEKSGGRQFDFKTGITSDLTLYAHWTARSSGSGGGSYSGGASTTYTVRFESNGGTAVASQTVTSGGCAVEPDAPERTGYIFTGWFKDASLTTAFSFSQSITSNITLYAGWESAEAEIFESIGDYFEATGLTVTDTTIASMSEDMMTEAEVTEFLTNRGFGQIKLDGGIVGYPITYTELKDGTLVDETVVDAASESQHPVYTTFYRANELENNAVFWVIYVLDGEILVYPTSFNSSTDSYVEIVLTESEDGTILSYYDDTYYRLVEGSSTAAVTTFVKPVEKIDTATLDALDLDALCDLVGAEKVDNYGIPDEGVASLLAADVPITAQDIAQEIPSKYGEKLIVVSLGDSYSSGESIAPYIGQQDSSGRNVDREDYVKSADWRSHRSTRSWGSQIVIPDVDGTMGDYYVPYHTEGTENIQWYFYAISGAVTANYATEGQDDKSYTMPHLVYHPLLFRKVVYKEYPGSVPTENEVLRYIGDPSEVDYVTISMGGNDANFAGIVADVAINSHTVNPRVWFGKDSVLDRDIETVWERRGEILGNIEDMCVQIAHDMPNATIIYAGYPILYNDNGKGSVTATAYEANLVNEKVSAFNDLIRARVNSLKSKIKIEYVDIESKFAGHAAYSHGNKAGADGAWLNGLIIPATKDDLKMNDNYSAGSMHPNVYGAQKYAEAVNEVIASLNRDETGARSISGVITIADTDTDMTNNLPLASASIKLDWFNGATVGPNPNYGAFSNVDGSYFIADVIPGKYTITVSKEGYLTVTGTVTISSEEGVFYNAALEVIPEGYLGTGIASGVVKDVLTGAGVSDLGLRVYPGVNSTEGEPVATDVTGVGGRYSFSLDAGNYTVEVIDNRLLADEDARYITNTFNIKVLGGITIPNQDGFVTNGLAAEQIRIVLKWGEYPSDLDSHLVGPSVDGGRFHTYFASKDYYADGTLMANLDLDDVSSYGPETTTIYKMTPGVYTFSVYDFSNGESLDSTALATSGAYVEVYLGASTTPIIFHVPTGEGTLWTVFNYNSETGVLTPVNDMLYHTGSSETIGGELPYSGHSTDWQSDTREVKDYADDSSSDADLGADPAGIEAPGDVKTDNADDANGEAENVESGTVVEPGDDAVIEGDVVEAETDVAEAA